MIDEKSENQFNFQLSYVLLLIDTKKLQKIAFHQSVINFHQSLISTPSQIHSLIKHFHKISKLRDAPSCHNFLTVIMR